MSIRDRDRIMAFIKGGTEIITLLDNHYTLVDIKSYTETDQYTTTSSTNQFTCTDQSLNFTTTAQTNGADLIVIEGSMNAHSNADNNGYGIMIVYSTNSDLSSGTTAAQTGRYGEQLMSNEYRNTTTCSRVTSLTANTTYYVRMFAMIQRPSSGTITLNVDGYATSALSLIHI